MSTPGPAAPAPSRQLKVRGGILVAAALLAFVAGGLWLREWWWVGRFIEATDDAFVGADITTDGVIGNRHARVGDYATVGAQLMSIVPVTGLYVDANFKESQIAHMRPGQPAVVEADALRGVRFHGTVESLAPATGAQFSLLPAENATGNFTKIVLSAPLIARLSRKIDPRLLIAAGLFLFAFSLWQMTPITSEWTGLELFWLQFLRGFSILLCIVPATNMALGSVPAERLKMASALFNTMRNLGGAIGSPASIRG